MIRRWLVRRWRHRDGYGICRQIQRSTERENCLTARYDRWHVDRFGEMAGCAPWYMWPIDRVMSWACDWSFTWASRPRSWRRW